MLVAMASLPALHGCSIVYPANDAGYAPFSTIFFYDLNA
jgi:hypothetical protein